ncbi:unnamed protein product [Gordionus sp. m RMFG-2023]
MDKIIEDNHPEIKHDKPIIKHGMEEKDASKNRRANDKEFDRFDIPSSQHKYSSELSPSAAKNYTKDMLAKAAQNFVNDINLKRAQDSTLIEDFGKTLQEYVSKCTKTVEDHYFQMYDSTGQNIQEKVQKLFTVLENITQLENELNDFKHDIELIYKDIQNDFMLT